jgi:penicillin amidase
MAFHFRKFTATFIFIFIIGLAISVLGYRLVVKSLPDYNEESELRHLEAEVTVYWDEYKVPHVYAQNSPDMFRAAGYLAAQERLWQMDLSRRAALGRLSEIFGERTLEEDIFFRTWGFGRVAGQLAEYLPETTLETLEFYTEGINTFIETHQNRLPVEFAILGYKPGKWKITDSIAIARLMAFQLSFTWHLEPVLHLIAEKVGREKALELFPEFPPNAPVIVTEQSGRRQKIFAELLHHARQARKIFGGSGTLAASNSWVISPKKSVTGKPILANDPHLDLRFPSVWYEMHLVSDEFDVMGVTFPGIPGVVIGHNRAAAWGLTNGMVDDADFYFEKINPENPEQYWDGKAWLPFEIVREEIQVKDLEDPVYLDVLLSKHGPVVSPVHPLYKSDSLAMSVRWTGHEMSDDFGAILKVNRATSWQDFLAAIKNYKVPAQNFIYADSSGTIGYALAGKIPLRRDKNGFLPYSGWEGKGDWIGELPFEKMPKQANPASGFIATANNKMTAQSRGVYFGNAWEPDSRIQRITQLLSEKKMLAIEDFKRMHTDVQSYHAKKMLAPILSALEKASLPEQERYLLDILESWDFNESWDSVPATIYNAIFVHLLRNALEDEMGVEIFEEFNYWTNFPIRAMENLVMLPDSDWWDDKNTPEHEKMDAIILKSFKGALQELNEKMGDGPGFWEWGLLHKVTFTHPLGKQQPFDRIFNAGPYPIGGSPNTIAKAEFRFFRPYRVDAGASMRQIVDLADPDRTWSVIAGGQSGQPFSDHFDDQIQLWLAGRYKIARMARDEIAKYASAKQVFRPKK